MRNALVVEDEVLIRFHICGILEDHGFATREAGTTDEALQELSVLPGIDLLVTDIEMAGSVDGLELARRLRAGKPKLPIIVMSGRHVPHPQDLPPRVCFLVKPVAVEMFIELLRELFSRE